MNVLKYLIKNRKNSNILHTNHTVFNGFPEFKIHKKKPLNVLWCFSNPAVQTLKTNDFTSIMHIPLLSFTYLSPLRTVVDISKGK